MTTRSKRRSASGFIEASPGTGKSLAALCALLRHHKRTGRRVALSTFTRALQRSIPDAFPDLDGGAVDVTSQNNEG